jgi:PEGA domain
MAERSSLLIGTIAVVSALVAFAAVRVWFVPVRAAVGNPATLTVATEPAGAELLIDSQPRGTTPQTLTIDPGLHTVLVRTQGAERTVRLSLGSGAQMAQYLDLKPTVPADAVSRGRLSIVTDPRARESPSMAVHEACRPS